MKTKKSTSVSSLFAFLLVAGVSSVWMWSCSPENPGNPNEEEVITSVVITATEGSNSYTFAYSDPDGDGGNPPAIDTIVLSPSLVYNVTIDFLDETKNPVDTISAEILAEGDEHQIFFTVTSANLTTAYADMDINMAPIGLVSTWTTGAISTGTVMITLKHQPDGTKDGNITTGETDVEISFPIRIE